MVRKVKFFYLSPREKFIHRSQMSLNSLERPCTQNACLISLKYSNSIDTWCQLSQIGSFSNNLVLSYFDNRRTHTDQSLKTQFFLSKDLKVSKNAKNSASKTWSKNSTLSTCKTKTKKRNIFAKITFLDSFSYKFGTENHNNFNLGARMHFYFLNNFLVKLLFAQFSWWM